MNLIDIDINKLIPYKNNPRKNDGAVDPVANSIREFGFKVPLVIDKENNVVCGHTRLKAAKKLGLKTVPCVIVDDLSEEQIKAFRLADNKVGELAEWDFDLLGEELDGIFDIDMSEFGFEPDDVARSYADSTPGALKAKFIMPPFSVLDARQGDWQKRKKAWLKIVQSEKGREDNLLGDGMLSLAKAIGSKNISGTSVFDPVLAEVLLHWFSPRGGAVLDPFSGGSVRGIVSQLLEREYIGVDLRAEQIEENEAQFDVLEHSTDFYGEILKRPHWICGDSKNIDALVERKDFDFLFTCPPYGDLEVYSDDPNDLSNMSYDDFKTAYYEIIKKSVDKLKDDAFAAIVVGEIRDNRGVYRNFIGDTIAAFEAAGMKYYNELILVTMCGTAALRANIMFEASRKVVNTHQKALVFYKAKDDASFIDLIETFDRTRATVPMKKSVLVFLKGDAKLAKADIQNYDFDLF